MTPSERLRMLRTMRGLTQEELGRKAGVPNTQISLAESGKITFAGEWDARIREALDWTPDVDVKLDELTQETK